MPRAARASVIDIGHHVYQAAMPRRALFFSDKDRQVYLETLREQSRLYQVDILSYCLLRDAIHLLAIPRRKGALSRAVGRTHFIYAHYLNKRRNLSGTLWRNRFQSCMLDEKHMKIAAQYVETLPVYGKLVGKAEKYPWSSAASHVSWVDGYGVLSLDVWPAKRSRKTWSNFLSMPMSAEIRERLRMHTQTGRPLGNDRFVEEMEKQVKRRLRALPVGRPRKEVE